MDLSPRAVIAGRYRVEARVGAGGMGEVWVGEAIATNQRVAVKTLLPAAALNHEVVARFKREAYLLGRINSFNIARVVDFVPDEVYGLVLVMEFVEGDPLSRMLQERTMTVEEGWDLAVGLANALKDLHAANIIHRDLKPGNIIMAPLPDGRRRAVVIDFGVSRMMSDKSADEDEELTGITRADMAVGTIEYMAPEQILNSRSVTPASDIYAAGAMLFRACAGRHIFAVNSDTELAQKKLTNDPPDLPLNRTDPLAVGLARVVGKMIKRRPKERYPSADEVLADLAALRVPAAAPAPAPETEGPTLDTRQGIPPAAMAAAAARAAAGPASAPHSAPVSAPTPASAPAPVSARAPISSQAPVAVPAAAAPQPAAPQAAAPQAQPAMGPPGATTTGGDSRLSIAVPQAQPGPPARRGVSPLVTLALVAAALVGGVVLGPRILQQAALRGLIRAPAATEPAPATATPPPPAPAPTPTAAATQAPATQAATAQVAAAPTSSASAAPSASASVGAAAPASTTKPAAADAGPGAAPAAGK